MNGLLSVVKEDHPSSPTAWRLEHDDHRPTLSPGYNDFSALRFGSVPIHFAIECFHRSSDRRGLRPQRSGPLVPEVVAWLMMYVGLHTTSMTQGLTQAWGLVRARCPWLGTTIVSEEAFCQARQRLTLGFWRNLWRTLTHRFEDRFASSLLWKNTFRLLAIDGSDVDLPIAPKVTQCFGQPRNQHGQRHRPQAKLVSLCSVLTGFCLDFKLIGKRFTEHHALRHLIRHLRRNDLVLMDRGFFSLQGDLANPVAWRALPASVIQSACWPCETKSTSWRQ